VFPAKLRVGMMTRVDRTRVIRGGIYGHDGSLLKTLALVDVLFILAVNSELFYASINLGDAREVLRWRCPILIATRCGTVGWLHRDDVECLEHVWREPA